MDTRERRRYVIRDGEGGCLGGFSWGGRVLSHAGGTLGFLIGLAGLVILFLISPIIWLVQEVWATIGIREKPPTARRPGSTRGGQGE